MRTPQENAKGYDDNSPINFAKDLQGKYFLIHGAADDNVHYQNSMEMISALGPGFQYLFMIIMLTSGTPELIPDIFLLLFNTYLIVLLLARAGSE